MCSKFFKTDWIKKEDVAAAYENELSKYQIQVNTGDLFTAPFVDIHNKTVSEVEKLSLDLNITGSQSWFYNQRREMLFRKDLYGSFFLTVEVNLPKNTLENVATSLVQEGFVITVENSGSASGEMKLRFMVHMDHRNDEDCTEDVCLNKMELQTFIENDGFDVLLLGNKYIGTHVSAVHQKLTSFVKDIIQAPNNGIFSENFQTQLVFDIDGEARIIALIWPRDLEEINLNVSANFGRLTLVSDLIDFVQSNVSVSSDERILRSSFC